MWNPLTGKIKNVFEDPMKNEITALTLDRNMKRTFLGDNTGQIKCFNMKNGKFLKSLTSHSLEINFENCEVPVENLIGQEGEGYKIALSALEGGRIGIAAQSIGMARSALEVAIDYAKQRESFGTAIINHQAVGFRLAECATQLEAARQLMWHAATLRDAGLPCLKEAAMAKLFASETAEKICSAAIQTLGGYGVVSDFPVERIYRDVRVCQIYEGTSDVQKIIIQRALA